MQNGKVIYPSWKEIEHLVDMIADSMKRVKEWKEFHIYGIPRGGLIPAVMLSHKLKLPFISSEFPHNSEPIFLIDDVNDTGKTFLKNLIAVAPYHDDIYVCSLYLKTHSSCKGINTIYGQEVPNDVWVHFPWEEQNDTQPFHDLLRRT